MSTDEKMPEVTTDSSLGHMPSGERWEFDRSVASVFDDMLVRYSSLEPGPVSVLGQCPARGAHLAAPAPQ